MRHIEFLGIPGSGKSTFYNKLVIFLKDKNLPVFKKDEAVRESLKRDPNQKFFNIISCIPPFSYSKLRSYFNYNIVLKKKNLKNFHKRFPVIWDLAFKEVGNQKSRLLKKWIVDLFSQYQYISQYLKKEEILVFDEGIYNRALSLYAYGREEIPEEEIYRFVEAAPPVSAVIKLEAGVKVCKKRVSERKRIPKRIALHSSEDIDRILNRSEKIVEIVAQALKEKKVTVISLDNSGRNPGVDRLYETVDKIIGK